MLGNKGNRCCPKLKVLSCGDTEKHCHLICGYAAVALSDETVKNQCIGEFSECVLQDKVGASFSE